ncbi:type II toxin-antitoxin system toxin DNA ADP-ribosyl transferase DarT [Pseudoalteromonas sp. 1181_04]|uniref:type II toxin-antitoxin system toxin DNA ADP-ribosyl transferase DarT n=1 Tax=Pseudoalteromonas sp. 1181_04 TaxID=2604450 RepID=UPI00406351DD
MTVKVSHITHIDNLDGIIQQSCLWSDAKRIELGLVNQNIGYTHIKQRRLIRPVNVAAGGTIGQYVPFNFCPRSVMLFVIYKGHQDFNDGQERVLHLISDVDTIRLNNPHCFFTDIHADLDYAEQIDDFTRMAELNIQKIINERYWQDFKEEKQAEFLAFESVQWTAIEQIGVKTQAIANEVNALLQNAQHKPKVVIQPEWYY